MFPDDIMWFVAYKSSCYHVLKSVDSEMATEQVDMGQSTPPPKRGGSLHMSNLAVEEWEYRKTDVRIMEDGTIVYERIREVEGEEVCKDSFKVPGTIPYCELSADYSLPLRLMKLQVPCWINFSEDRVYATTWSIPEGNGQYAIYPHNVDGQAIFSRDPRAQQLSWTTTTVLLYMCEQPISLADTHFVISALNWNKYTASLVDNTDSDEKVVVFKPAPDKEADAVTFTLCPVDNNTYYVRACVPSTSESYWLTYDCSRDAASNKKHSYSKIKATKRQQSRCPFVLRTPNLPRDMTPWNFPSNTRQHTM